MGLETVTNIADLVAANPSSADAKSQGDDHIRNIKTALLNSLGGFPGAIIRTGTDGGVANACTVTMSPVLAAYSNRMTLVFSPTVANTGASTIKVDGLAAVPLRSVSGAELAPNDLAVGTIYAALYTGAEFRLIAVTKNYIDQLAFNPVLPAQAGNAGKVLGTNGINAAWTVQFGQAMYTNNTLGGF